MNEEKTNAIGAVEAIVENEKPLEESNEEVSSEDTKTIEQAENIDADRESEEKSERESKEFISDFAPEPIKIPNYNSEKEHKKRSKAREKDKKRLSQKNTRSHKILMKALLVLRCIVMSILLFAIISAALMSLLIRVGTSEYAIENSIRNNHPENFVIGKIENPEALNLKKSSSHASIADILRDNAMGITTYNDIVLAVGKSSYSEFIAQHAHGVIAYLLYDEKYSGVRGRDVSAAIRKNISFIKLVTEIELGESACDDFGAYVDNSSAFDEIKPEALSKLPMVKYTKVTKIAFSLMVLACLVVALMLLVVIAAAICGGHAHSVIGWSCMLSGIGVAAAGLLFRPAFNVKSAFIQSVYQAIISGFHHTVIVYGCITFALGFIVFIIGHAISEPEYEED